MTLDEQDKEWIVSEVLKPVLNEMGARFGEVNARLDRMDATIALHGKHMAAGARAIAGWNDWTVKADEDYRRVLAELAELKLRLNKPEGLK